MKKFVLKLYVLFFIIFFILPTILYGMANTSGDENLENRNMAEKPVFSIKNIQTFPGDYENYYNDNLPYRTDLIKANALLNLKFFKQSPENKVIIGKDGWLFYDPPIEDSDPIGQCTGDKLSNDSLEYIANNLTKIRDTLKSEEREFIPMLCPNKESIYGKYFLPSYYNFDNYTMGDQLADYLQKNTDLNFVYTKKNIIDAINKYPNYDFYYKVDTHWNYLGGYIAAKDLLKSMDILIPEFSEISISSVPGRVGDLSNMTGIPEYFISDELYTVDGYIQELPSQNPDIASVITYKNAQGNGKSVLVVRDSFSEGLYPYLNSTFSEVNYIHMTEYYPSVIEACDPDIVIVEVVERYLLRFGSFSLR